MFQPKSSRDKLFGGMCALIGFSALLWAGYCVITNPAPLFFEGVFVDGKLQTTIVGRVDGVAAVKKLLNNSERLWLSQPTAFLSLRTRAEVNKGNAIEGFPVSPRTVRWVDVTFWGDEKQGIFMNMLDAAPARIQHGWAVGTGMSINPTLRLHMMVSGVEWIFQGPLNDSESPNDNESSGAVERQALMYLQRHSAPDGVRNAVLSEQDGVLRLRFTDDLQLTLEELKVLEQQGEKVREMLIPVALPTTSVLETSVLKVLQQRFEKTPSFPNLLYMQQTMAEC